MKKIIPIAILSGFRAANIVNLRWNQIDLHKGLIFIGVKHKGRKKRKVLPIHHLLINFFQNLIQEVASIVEQEY